MNTLTVTIRKTHLHQSNRVGANFFVVVKLMQAPHVQSDENVVLKQRTDISVNAHSGLPNFIKNNMHFKNFKLSQVGATSLEFSVYIAPEGAS